MKGDAADPEGAKDTKQHEEEPLVFFVELRVFVVAL
jgi:hypothetical protein